MESDRENQWKSDSDVSILLPHLIRIRIRISILIFKRIRISDNLNIWYPFPILSGQFQDGSKLPPWFSFSAWGRVQLNVRMKPGGSINWRLGWGAQVTAGQKVSCDGHRITRSRPEDASQSGSGGVMAPSSSVVDMMVEDAEALDCGVCFLPLKPPIFQVLYTSTTTRFSGNYDGIAPNCDLMFFFVAKGTVIWWFCVKHLIPRLTFLCARALLFYCILHSKK